MGEKIKESWYSSLPSLYLIRRESGVLRIAMAVNRPVLRVHENLPLALTVAPHQFLPFKFTSVGIRCSPFNDKTLISIKPNTSHLNHDTLACRFHAAQFAGTHFPSLFSTLTFFFNQNSYIYLLIWLSNIYIYRERGEWAEKRKKTKKNPFFKVIFYFFNKLIRCLIS